jgi:predicted PurR-regulated permease PerM
MPIVDQPKDLPVEEPEMNPADVAAPAAESGLPLEAPLPVKTVPTQWILIGLGTIAFLYFARPVVLPLFLAILAAMALKPLMRWLAVLRLPPAPSAAIIFVLLVACLSVGFFQLGRPAVAWIDDAPQHVADLKARVQLLYPNAMKMGHAVAAVSDLGAATGAAAGAVTNPTAAGAKKATPKPAAPTVEIRDQRGTASILNWTGTILAGLGEVMVLIYLILASGDLFLQKLVRVMPTLKDKKQAIEFSHEIQQNISNYLFAVTLINSVLGAVVAVGLYVIGVPKAAMWGMLVAVMNFVPYFGPVIMIIILAIVGVLTFDTLWQGLLPAAWFTALHLLESNFVTPILLGRRFTLNPVAIFVSLIFWLWLWGIPGALLSAPILVLVKAICDRVPRAVFVSELIGR